MQSTPTKRQYRIPSPPRTPVPQGVDDQRGQMALFTPPELKARLSSMPRNARYSVSKGYTNGTGSPAYSPHQQAQYHSPQRAPLGPTRSEPILSSNHCSPSSSSAIFQSSTDVLNNIYSHLSPTRALQPMCETMHSPNSNSGNDYHSPTKPSSSSSSAMPPWSATRTAPPMFVVPYGSSNSRKGKRTFTEEELAEEAEKTEEDEDGGMDVDMEMDETPAPLPVLNFGRPNGTAPSTGPRRTRNMPNRGTGRVGTAGGGGGGGGLGRTQSLPADVFNQVSGF